MNASRPPRRLPHKIYVRRRIAAVVVLVVAVLIIVGVATAIARLAGGGDETKNAQASSQATSSVAAELDKEAKNKASESTSATSTSETSSSESSTSVAPEDLPVCDLKSLEITAKVDHADYSADQVPQFYMTVKNTGDKACRVNLAEQRLRYEVYNLQTNERVWADSDCNTPVDDENKVFPAGEEVHYAAKWSKKASAPEQCRDRQPVPPGGYFLHGVIGDHASPAVTFNVH